MAGDETFMKKLIEIYRAEASDHLKAITDGLLEMEQGVDTARTETIIETVYRATHSLKGASRAVHFSEVEQLCQAMETIFASMKKKDITPTQDFYDKLHLAVSAIAGQLSASEQTSPPPISEVIKQIAMIAKTQNEFPKEKTAQEETPPSPSFAAKLESRETLPEHIMAEGAAGEENSAFPSPQITSVTSDSIRVSVSRLDAVLSQTEELIGLKRSLLERDQELRAVLDLIGTMRIRWLKALHLLKQRERASSSGMPGHDSETVGYFDQLYTTIISVEKNLSGIGTRAFHDSHGAGIIIDALLDDVKNILMFPFSSLLTTFPKIVRDLSREKKRRAELRFSGADIEIDRRILDEMRDPFLHLIRNSIDHGIETPEIRISRGKSPVGTISIVVNRIEENRAEILFSDDGQGLDEDKIRLAARKAGHVEVKSRKTLSREDALELIFFSGVSTSDFITDLSGRGLGLAIAREKIEQLGGFIDIAETQLGVGTTFRVVIPLTRATFRGVRIRVYDHEFIIPTAAVVRAQKLENDDIFFVKGTRTIRHDGVSLQLIALAELLSLPAKKDEKPASTVLIVSSGSEQIAVAVHEILGEEEVLVRSFDAQLSFVRHFNGAAVLGSSRVVPVISVSALVKGIRPAESVSPLQEARGDLRQAEPKSILVVEDSITARMLLKNILEGAGYRVMTANDGIEGFTKLLENPADLVVTDVDMPRMNGFDLTAKIKTDRRYAETPVVLVTALESPEDKKRGIDAGADAYIVKSSFDQSNLIEVIERLI